MPNYATVLGKPVNAIGTWPGHPEGLNYPGSSGFGSPIIGSPAPGTPPASGLDYGVWDPIAGKVVSLRTRKPWNGMEPRTGKRYVNGTETPDVPQQMAPVAPSSAQNIDPNSPSRYRAIEIPKDPAVSAATDSILASFKTDADAALKDFNSHLADYNNSIKGAITASQGANDIGPLSNTLRAQQSKYSNTLDNISKQYGALNTDAAARERAQVAALEATTPLYDRSVGNIENVAASSINRAVSRAQARSGLPIGSDMAGATARSLADALTPLELAKITNRQGIITGTALPEEQRITGMETNRVSNFLPAIAGSQFTSARDVELGIQNLKQAAAQGNWQLVSQLIQVPQLAAEVRQRLLQGDVSILGALGQIRDQSSYRGLQDLLGATLQQPQYFPTSQPAFPNPPALPAPGRPTQIQPQQPGRYPVNPVVNYDNPSQSTRDAVLRSILAGQVNNPNLVASRGPAPRYQLDPSAPGYYIDSETGDYYPLGSPAIAGSAPIDTGEYVTG